MSSPKAHSQTLYDADYLQWIKTTIEKLQSHDYAKVEWENLIEIGLYTPFHSTVIPLHPLLP